MANTTFNGPVRSENGFQTISINQSTGTVTVTGTFGAATSVTSLAATTVTATGNVTADSATAPAAGGMAAFLASSTAGLGVYVGSGAPTIAAAQGSLYLRTDGSSTSTRAYINTNGSTTWTAITTAA
jgi:subtilisin family serine protease